MNYTNNIRNQKDSLARLLATEDLVIEHRKTPTAYFDLKNRKLVCPILKDDMSADMYDLFMGHEVSHALHTPEEGWHDAIFDNGKYKGAKFKGYLNVLKDVRIEKAIKEKYAGLRRAFFDAYKELHNDLDFFGVKNKNVNKLAFIDRINLYFKVGHTLMIDFSDKELKIITAINTKMDTWDKVVKMAEYLFELSKDEVVEPQEDPSQQMVPQFNNEDGIEDFGDEDSSSSMGMESEEEGEEESDSNGSPTDEDAEDKEQSGNTDEGDEDGDSSSKGEEQKSDEPKTEKSDMGGSGAGEANESITDKISRKNEEKFLHQDNEKDEYSRDNNYINLNTKQIKFDDYRIPYKKVLEELKEGQEENMSSVGREYWDREDYEYSNCKNYDDVWKYVNDFLDHNKNIVNYMAKEFDMRKAASNYKKAQTAKSGEIDMQKIQNYLIKDDIFKKVTIVPDGKNHGLLMLVDWSGSMSDCISETLEQCIVLTMFARRVGIPHRVYAFSDGYREDYDDESYEAWRDKLQGHMDRKEFYTKKVKLFEFFSDKMNQREFKEMVMRLNVQVEAMFYYGDVGRFQIPCYSANNYNLSGTPLDESLVVMRDYIIDFKNNYNLDKLQFVTLTDGESFHCDGLRQGYGRKQFFHDRKAQRTFEYSIGRYSGEESSTDSLLKWLEKTTGVDTVGFFLCKQGHNAFDNAVQQFGKSELSYWEQREANKEDYKVFRKDGGFKVPCSEKSGYKEFYLLNIKKMQIVSEDDTLDVEAGASKQKLKGAMKRMGNNKLSQRKILQHFIKKVA